MKGTQRIFRYLSCLLVFSLFLAACQPATPTPAPVVPATAVVAPPATKAPAAGQKVTVRWYHITTAEEQKAFYQKVADDYMAAHPNVTIEITVLENEAFKSKLTTLMQSGDPPDLFQSWGGGVMVEYAKAGLLKDITADMAGGWGDTFGKGALGVYAYNGKQYGVPRDMGEVGFWYNKALFKQAGIDTPPATWTALLDDVKKLKAAGIVPIAAGAGDKWPVAHYWMWANVRIGGQAAFDKAFSLQGTFADEPFVKAGDALKQLIDLQPFQDGFLGATYGDAAGVFGNKKAAMQLMGQWDPSVQKDNSADKQGVGADLAWFPFPAIEGGAGDPSDAMGGGNGWAVGKNASPEAIDFLKALTTKDEQCGEAKIGLGIPVVKGAETCITDPYMKIIQENVAKAKYFQLYYDQFLPPATGAASNDAVQELFAGTKTPAEVAKAVQDSYAAEVAKSGGVAPTAPAPAAKPVTVRWYHITTAEEQKAFYQKVADDYMAAHPNVTVEITVLENEAFKSKLTTLMQSGDPPDLFQSWGGGVMVEYAKASLLKDITADMAGGWGDTFGKGALGVYAYNGKQYGVPRDMGEVGFWYNKALFKQAGIDTPPATWAELLADVKKLKAAGIVPIAAGAGDKWPVAHYWMWANVRIGGQAAFDKAFSQSGGSFTDEPFVKAGDALKQLIDLQPFQDGFLGATYGDAAGVFGNKKAAMQLMGQWDPSVQKDNSADKQGVGADLAWFPFPAIEGGAGDPSDAMGGGNGWAVGKNAPPEAIDFLKALTTKDEQCGEAKIGLGIPVVKGAETCITDPYMKIIQENVAKAKYFQLYYDQFLPPATGAASNDAVQELFAGTKTPAEVAKAVQDSYAAELKK